MPVSTISPQGQVRIPGEVRKAAGLRVGQLVQLAVELASSRVRVRLRPRGKVTVPAEVRKAAHLDEGTLVEIQATTAGSISVRAIEWQPLEQPRRDQRSPDQAWFWTSAWLKGEEEASTQIRAGKVRSFVSDQDFLDSLIIRER